jgi:hypothetical protein
MQLTVRGLTFSAGRCAFSAVRCVLALTLALSSAAVPAAGPSTQPARALSDFAYWQRMAGWWRAENTYLDGKLDYKIRTYHSIVHIELDGARYRETEYKFYPPGPMARGYGQGQVREGEGVETVTVTTGDSIDDTGTVRVQQTLPVASGEAAGSRAEDQTSIQVLGPDAAVRVTPNGSTGIDTYRMYIFSPTPERRYRSNFGIVSDRSGPGAANALPGAAPGDLRGYSLFRESRMAPAEFERWRAEFRTLNAVSAVVQSDAAGRARVSRLAP